MPASVTLLPIVIVIGIIYIQISVITTLSDSIDNSHDELFPEEN